MRSKTVEDKEKTENLTSFRKFLRINFYTIIPTLLKVYNFIEKELRYMHFL